MPNRFVWVVVSLSFYFSSLEEAAAESRAPKKAEYVFSQDPQDDIEFPQEKYPRCGKSANIYLDALRKVTIGYGEKFRFSGEVWPIDNEDDTGVDARKPAAVNGGEVRAKLYADKSVVKLSVFFFGTDEASGKVVCASGRHFSLLAVR